MMRFQSRLGRVLAAVALAGLAMSGPAWGQTSSSGTFKTGDELWEICTSSDEDVVSICDWYIMGVHDAVILYQDLEWADHTICIPESTEAETLRNIVVAHLRSAGDREFTAVSMIYNALEGTYAC